MLWMHLVCVYLYIICFQSTVGGQLGVAGVRVALHVGEDHRKGKEHVPTQHLNMAVLSAQV